jgi:(R)-2-hydroxyisocaproyl-CoA dehydratase beta subunit
MNNIAKIIAQLRKTVDNPAQVISDYSKKTGKGVVGCFPYYTPEEIVHAAGMLPIGLWGGETQVAEVHSILPAFTCPIMQSNMEFALRGVYNKLKAVIIPAPCDTLKSVGQDWLYVIPQIKAILLVYPQMRKIEGGVQYLKTEFARVKKEIEAINGEPISDQALTRSIEIYNTHRAVMRTFTELAPSYPVTIPPGIRHLVIKSSFFMEKGQHTEVVNALMRELQKLPAEKSSAKKIILTGITAEPDGLLDLFQENGLTVVGDDLAQESRLFRTDVPAGSDPLTRLARQWSLIDGCSLAYDPEKKRGAMIIELAKKTRADAIILCMMKFCDPEEFDYPILATEFEQAKLPLLYLEVDQQNQSLEQLRTRVQGFAEMINASEK